jgi:hypothetical protein
LLTSIRENMKPKNTEPKRNDKKARALRVQYLKDQKALDEKYRADAKALGYILVSDSIAKVRDYFRRATAVVKKYSPQLVAEFRELESDTIKKLLQTKRI